MLGQLCVLARVTTSTGPAAILPLSTILALLMLQFWQNRHPRLHPAVPKLNIPVPGKKMI